MFFGRGSMAKGSTSNDRAAGQEVLPGVSGGADRIAHVVEAIEEADQVELPGVTRRSRDLELGPIAHPGLAGPLRGTSRSTARGSRIR